MEDISLTSRWRTFDQQLGAWADASNSNPRSEGAVQRRLKSFLMGPGSVRQMSLHLVEWIMNQEHSGGRPRGGIGGLTSRV